MFLYCSAFWIPSLLIAITDLPYKEELKDTTYIYTYVVESITGEQYATAQDGDNHKLIVNLKCEVVD